jgi:hypothetical protein
MRHTLSSTGQAMSGESSESVKSREKEENAYPAVEKERSQQ